MIKPPFCYVGNKYRLLKYILPLIPPHKYYGEPFGGTAAVLLNKPYAEIEVYNDIDSEIVNFYKVLREKPEELKSVLFLTPHSREELWNAHVVDPNDSDVERARKFFIRARMSMFCLQNSRNSYGSTAVVVRRSMPAGVSAFLSSIERMDKVVMRLRTVQFENIDFRKFFKMYVEKWHRNDPENTFVYLDPPYVVNSPKDNLKTIYKSHNNFTIEEMETLLKFITETYPNIKYMISGYDNELYRHYLLTDKWKKYCFNVDAKVNVRNLKNRRIVECVWVNYNPHSNTNTPDGTLDLF